MIPTYNISDRSGNLIPWDTAQVKRIINKTSLRTSERLIEKSKLLPRTIKLEDVVDEKNNPLKKGVINNQVLFSKKRRDSIYIIQLHKGTIAASNRLNTKGAQVEVLLPKLS